MVKVSIITVALDAERYLEDAIRSVRGQAYGEIEYIVVDGGSTDGTLDIIRRHEDGIDRWISEPDAGIADAMNKGIGLATGDFIYFLNSDDYLESDDAIGKASAHLVPGVDIVLFGMYLEKDGRKTYRAPGRFGAATNFKLGLSHQGTICARALFDRIGRFDERFRITMDYDFFLRAHRAGARWAAADFPLATMRLIGISSREDWQGLDERFAEEREVHRKHSDSTWWRLIYGLYWALYLPYRRLRYRATGRPA